MRLCDLEKAVIDPESSVEGHLALELERVEMVHECGQRPGDIFDCPQAGQGCDLACPEGERAFLTLKQVMPWCLFGVLEPRGVLRDRCFAATL